LCECSNKNGYEEGREIMWKEEKLCGRKRNYVGGREIREGIEIMWKEEKEVKERQNTPTQVPYNARKHNTWLHRQS
jgi:hypothetical protein